VAALLRERVPYDEYVPFFSFLFPTRRKFSVTTRLRRRRHYFFVQALKRINKARWGKKIKGLSSGFSSGDVLRGTS
jgi:hypothetical protein